MDPITITVIAGSSAAVAAGGAALSWWRSRQKKKEAEERRKRLGSAQVQSANVPPPPPPDPEIHREEEPDRQLTCEQIIEEVVSHISFTSKRVQIGERVAGEKVIGETLEEVPYPADDIDIRPIMNMSEFGSMLPNERMMPMDMQLMRASAGDAMVQIHLERTPMTELVMEPVYKEIKQAVYVLLDVSPSVFPGSGSWNNSWMHPYWRGITLSLLAKCRQRDAVFIMRTFAEKVGKKRFANSFETEQKLVDFIKTVEMRDGTNITNALARAIKDFQEEDQEYDEIDIMIITDGQDGKLNSDEMRATLKQAGIRLHAILLGEENDRLKQCSTIYQEIPSDGWIKSPQWSEIPLVVGSPL